MKNNIEDIDVLVVGAGLLGLACAQVLARAGRDVIIVDSEKNLASITSARNSGVIHAGIYYKKDSNKAKYCVRGREMLYRYARENHVPFENCGKLIVATSEAELPKLQDIKSRAAANGANDLYEVSARDAITLEPELSCTGGLYSPSTGIIDAHEFAHRLWGDAHKAGASLALQHSVTSGKITDDGIVVNIDSADPMTVRAKTVVNAGGIGAQDIARKLGVPEKTIPAQYLAKGNYFSVSGKKPFSRLVYPVPVPGGLGAHFTMNMAGQSLFGPDVEWIDVKKYRDLDYNVDDARVAAIAESVKRYWPGVESRTLSPAYSGIRPKLSAPGEPDGDFVIQGKAVHGIPGLINLYGIESPGLTSCLAIAEDVAAMAA